MRIFKKFSSEFKAKVALAALKGDKTLAQLSSEYGAQAKQIHRWKQQLKERVGKIFSEKADSKHKQDKELIDDLYRKIGELEVENDWIKKKLGF